ncbi:SGNH/GDSL hydrolase family protein [Actinophytocola sp. S1-96]|uniref:SGNH/GDSL hydrolase family protein n=1 Tax=Actinophytocola gossypii TaxID=2812003 RepID=A0ABT2JA08_9PSEU|nr:SGNH/GDSL hydrolase family protein [Actinophytocola gossypii]
MVDAVRAPASVRTVAVLGDSVGVGIGDPALDGGWRGFAPLLAEALGGARLTNLSVSGARVGGVRTDQLPEALALRPDVAVVVAGMNDTMRSDFDPARLTADLDHTVGSLLAAGALVITVRYHEHHRVFRLPGPLRRALAARIAELNAVLDGVAARRGIACVDLGALPGIYQPAAWSVDRLHPSELGHRMLAGAIAARVAEAGLSAAEVSLDCAGGRPAGPLAHWSWLVCKGVPWLCRRGRDLVPYALSTLLTALLRG